MKHHDIEFKEPVFHAGLNVTVRCGTKWLKARPGDDLEIFKTGETARHQMLRIAQVVAAVETDAVTLNYNPFPLNFEHSSSARTFPELAAQMAPIYGANWFTQPVVILYFWV